MLSLPNAFQKGSTLAQSLRHMQQDDVCMSVYAPGDPHELLAGLTLVHLRCLKSCMTFLWRYSRVVACRSSRLPIFKIGDIQSSLVGFNHIFLFCVNAAARYLSAKSAPRSPRHARTAGMLHMSSVAGLDSKQVRAVACECTVKVKCFGSCLHVFASSAHML